MRILVTGGAGYIGSHAVRALLAAGHEPVVLDNLCRGHRQSVPESIPFVEADLRDTEAVGRALESQAIEGVLHFAALAYVGESVTDPLSYYDNNVGGSVSLLQAMQRVGVQQIVFSSTCATYGEPDAMPIRENTPQRPINPYGCSKLTVERILSDTGGANSSFGHACLRYFNVAGCASDGSLGEDHRPETHLIPILLQVALGQRDRVTIFGDDYPTPDGTCIRDYIHVEDLVDAHVRVLEDLEPGSSGHYNLGLGHGVSVLEMVESARRVTGHAIPTAIGPRRPGDPPLLYADASRIRNELGWEPRHRELDGIVESAWKWFRENPEGYRR